MTMWKPVGPNTKVGNPALNARTPSQRRIVSESLPESRRGMAMLHEDGVFEFEYDEMKDGSWGLCNLVVGPRGKILAHTWISNAERFAE